jgi:hypothetical protein
MSDNTKEAAQSITSTIKKQLNNFLTTSENNTEDRICLVGNSEKLTKCLKQILSRISELNFSCELLIDWLKEVRDGKKLVDKHQALFMASDLAQEVRDQLKNLEPYTLKNDSEKAIRSSLLGYINNEAIETLIELKSKGKI